MRLDLATLPLIDSPGFDDLLSQGMFEPDSSYTVDMRRDGFCRVSLKSTKFDRLCMSVMSRLDDGFYQDLALWRLEKVPPPRYQDAWKKIKEVKQIAANGLIDSILRFLWKILVVL